MTQLVRFFSRYPHVDQVQCNGTTGSECGNRFPTPPPPTLGGKKTVPNPTPAGSAKQRFPSMRGSNKKTHDSRPPLPVFDSIAACSGGTGIPVGVIRKAKRAGCRAFTSSRVDLAELLRFLFASDDPTSGVNWRERLVAAEARLKELDLSEREASLVPMATARKVLGDVLGPMRTEILSASATLAGRCNPGDPEMARTVLEPWVRKILTDAADAIVRNTNEP